MVPGRTLFWFQVELFWIPRRTLCGKGFKRTPKGFYLEPKRVPLWGPIKERQGSALGTTEEPLSVLDITCSWKNGGVEHLAIGREEGSEDLVTWMRSDNTDTSMS